MGLDIYYFKQKRLKGQEKETYKHLVAKCNELGVKICRESDKGNDIAANNLLKKKKKYGKEMNKICELTHVAYYRKVNFLIRHFGYPEDATKVMEVPVTKEQVESLVEKCKAVLENHDSAEELLPTVDGPFFGGTDYDEDYYYDVKSVLKDFEKILSETDFDTHELIMSCWW